MKAIPGFEGLYSIDEQGNVYSYLKPWFNGNGEVKNHGPKKMKKLDQGFYDKVTLRKNGISHQLYVHRLVLLSFVGPCPVDHEVSHLNGDPRDNRLLNLAYMTSKENHRLRLEHCNYMCIKKRRLNTKIAKTIKKRYANGERIRHLAREYKVTDSAVRAILTGKTYAETGKPVLTIKKQPCDGK